MLRVRMALKIGTKVNGAACPVAEKHLKRQISQVLGIHDGKLILFHLHDKAFEPLRHTNIVLFSKGTVFLPVFQGLEKIVRDKL